MKRTWYITRKFPPSTGGMQNLSLHVAREIAREEDLTLVAWRRGNWGLPWFACVATLRLALGLATGRVRVLLLGDPVLSWLGMLAKLSGVPVAVVVHGLDIAYPSRTYQRYLDRMFWGRFDAYICISRHVRRLVDDRVAGGRSHLVHPGVEMPVASTAIPDAQAPRLLILGRVVPRKGMLWFVEQVMPLLLQRLPEVTLDIAGDGPDRAAIARVIVRHGLNTHVRILGEIDEATKQACIGNAHLVLLPNLPVHGDPEGFGLVALEAASHGRYVFAADLEGLRDAVRQPQAGRLLPPGDAVAWADAIADACSDLPSLIESGTSARTGMGDDFTWHSMGKRYLQVLHGLE